MSSYSTYKEAFRTRPLPLAFVDLERFDRNLRRLISLAKGTPLRLPSKSLRCLALIDRALQCPEVFGLMCFSVREAAWLARRGYHDLLVAYPAVDRAALEEACKVVGEGAELRLVVDEPEHVQRLASCCRNLGVTMEVCIDVDMSSRLLGIHFGVQRSPVRSAQDALALADAIRAEPRLRLGGLLCYEAQLAGLPDQAGPRASWIERQKFSAIRTLKARSRRAVEKRRRDVVSALRGGGHAIPLVNGGGTGSLAFTQTDPLVTELTAGSGLLSPALFDRFASLETEAAAGFALEVVRRPEPQLVTCFLGGYVASGAAGADRLPQPWLPRGIRLLPEEGAGEVQTPLWLPPALRSEVALGDPILFRHAKAGELFAHFSSVLLLEQRGAREVATYRGDRVPV